MNKLKLLLLLLTLCSCGPTESIKKHNIRVKQERQYKEIYCPKCNGTGVIKIPVLNN